MTERKRLNDTTSLLGGRPTGVFPSPEATGPRALAAARRVRRTMADAGVASRDDLFALVYALLCTISEREVGDFAWVACRLAPTMFTVFGDCAPCANSSDPRAHLAFQKSLSPEEIIEMTPVLVGALSLETVKMGFEPDLWLVAGTWILVALLVNEHGVQNARRCLFGLLSH